jgi:hypothetical protein
VRVRVVDVDCVRPCPTLLFDLPLEPSASALTAGLVFLDGISPIGPSGISGRSVAIFEIFSFFMAIEGNADQSLIGSVEGSIA